MKLTKGGHFSLRIPILFIYLYLNSEIFIVIRVYGQTL